LSIHLKYNTLIVFKRYGFIIFGIIDILNAELSWTFPLAPTAPTVGAFFYFHLGYKKTRFNPYFLLLTKQKSLWKHQERRKSSLSLLTQIILYGIMNIQLNKWCSFVISLSASNKPYSAYSVRSTKILTSHISPSRPRIPAILLFFSTTSKGPKSIYSWESTSWQLCTYVSRFRYGRFWSFSNRSILLGLDTLVFFFSYLFKSISQTTAPQNNSLHAQRI